MPGLRRNAASKSGASEPAYTKAEVREHAKRSDCWIIYDEGVFDVTRFVDEHPGGDIVLAYAGADATDAMDGFHAEDTAEGLADYRVGHCTDAKPTPIQKEYRDLTARFRKAGYFQASTAYYVYKVSLNLALAVGSVMLAFAYGKDDVRVAALAGFIMALCWQQAGWLAHDFLHHQVLPRSLAWIPGDLVGCVLQGFSPRWWMDKHNMHHAVPNVLHNDPDIDTMPFLAWSEKFIEGEMTSLPGFLVRFQYLVYVPLLCLARTSWLIQSYLTPWVHTYQGMYRERFFLTAHWVILFWICAQLPLVNALVFFAAAELGGGFLLGMVFSLNHNAMPVFDDDAVHTHDYATMQIVTGRDVEPSLFNTFITGGLNFQIEHHLWPQLPRHQFYLVAPEARKLAKKHNLTYHQTTLLGGTMETFARLWHVAHGDHEKMQKDNAQIAKRRAAPPAAKGFFTRTRLDIVDQD